MCFSRVMSPVQNEPRSASTAAAAAARYFDGTSSLFDSLSSVH